MEPHQDDVRLDDVMGVDDALISRVSRHLGQNVGLLCQGSEESDVWISYQRAVFPAEPHRRDGGDNEDRTADARHSPKPHPSG
ncbi:MULTISPECIES: hypothetical protein [unclassified Streptomyces]|uniref:hypothetical protein n=1 Tax=unclassified Streptomyces TaxID=2593676 RepID=UPI0037FCA4E8